MENDYIEKEKIINEDEIKNRLADIDHSSKTKNSLTRIATRLIILSTPYLTLFLLVLIGGLLMVTLGRDKGRLIGQNLINSILLIYPIVLSLFFIIPQIAIIYTTLLTYKRTTYTGFMYEGLFGSLLLFSILMFILLYNGQQLSLFVLIFASITLMILPLGSKFIKKPLIHSSYQNINLDESSDIVVKQSLFINEFKDGFTTRPVFKDIKEIINKIGNDSSIKEKIEKFAQFLSINGDLIGYDIADNKLKMYLRTTLIQRFDFEDPLILFKKIKQIIKKENLTSVNLDLNTWEMNFKLNKHDYDLYNNISYYKLSERILEQFSNAITEFLNENYMKSYEIINPYSELENIKIIKNSLATKILLPYFVGIFIYYIYALWIYFTYPDTLLGSSVNSPSILFILGIWPILMIYYAFNKLLLFVVFIVSNAILSVVLYYVVLKHTNKAKQFKTSKIKIIT